MTEMRTLGVISGTDSAQEVEQNAALGNATAANPVVARTDPTVDVNVKNVGAQEGLSGASISAGGSVTVSKDGNTAELVETGNLTMNSVEIIQDPTPIELTDAANVTPDFDDGNNFNLDLLTATGASRNLKNPDNPTVGQSGFIYFTQDATGGMDVVFDTYYKFAGGVAPSLTQDANAVDCLVYLVKSTTFIHCSLIPDIR